jgi:hypothetical protein
MQSLGVAYDTGKDVNFSLCQKKHVIHQPFHAFHWQTMSLPILNTNVEQIFQRIGVNLQGSIVTNFKE